MAVIEHERIHSRTCFLDLGRRDVMPGNASIVRAGDLRLRHTPAIEFIKHIKLYKRGRFDQWRIDFGWNSYIRERSRWGLWVGNRPGSWTITSTCRTSNGESDQTTKELQFHPQYSFQADS